MSSTDTDAGSVDPLDDYWLDCTAAPRDTRSCRREVAARRRCCASFAADPDRAARFHREARVLAALNHPHIAIDLRASKRLVALPALVMDLVEVAWRRAAREGGGPALDGRAADRDGSSPRRSKLPTRQGVIHRGFEASEHRAARRTVTVKVLDFGLVKAMEPLRDSSSRVTDAPTITTPAMRQAGMILGSGSPETSRATELG